MNAIEPESPVLQKLVDIGYNVEGKLEEIYKETGNVAKAAERFNKAMGTEQMNPRRAAQILRGRGVLINHGKPC